MTKSLRNRIKEAKTVGEVELLLEEGQRTFVHASGVTRRHWERDAAKRRGHLEALAKVS